MNASVDETALQKLPPTARGVSPSQRLGDMLWGKQLGQKKELEGGSVGSWRCCAAASLGENELCIYKGPQRTRP